jgi:glycosyltransferase involved in cell wall biosynthesis
VAEGVAVGAAYSIVTPTFEHASSIADYLDATLRSASLPFHWIIVDDASLDGTAERVEAWLAAHPSPLVTKTTLIRHERPLFETACDNIGFRVAETDVVIEIQADIHVREPRFDALMIEALETSPKPSAISGRCGHTFAALGPASPLSRLFKRSTTESVGLCGRAIETPHTVDAIRGHVYRCETVNRGPWLVLKCDLERHGYLDEQHFFLGNDDHDYHRRLFEAERRRPLYVPMAIHAPLGLGANRRKRSGINKEIFDRLSAEKRGSPDFHRFLASIKSSTPPQRIK